MAEPSKGKNVFSFTNFIQNHRRTLLPMLAAVVLGGVAVYIASRPDAPKPSAEKSASPSLQILNLAKDLLRQNQPAQAVEVLRNYLAAHRQDQEVRLRLVELFLRLGNPEQAEATLNEALAITPDNADVFWMQGVLAMHREQDPAEYFQRAARAPGASADVLGNYGLYLLSEDQPKEAEPYLRRAVEGGTRNGLVYEKLGTIVFLRKQIDAAYPLLQRATELAPRNVEAWAVLAEIQKNRNEPEEATASLQKALEAARGAQRGMVLMELGKARMAQGQWAEAAERFAQATAYPAAQTHAAFLAAQCFYHADNYAKAMHYIDQAAESAPDHPDIRQWKQKIENARFGPPAEAAQPASSLLTVPPEEKTKRNRREKSETATR